MSLRANHPNFWLVVVGDLLGLAWLGLTFTFVDNTSPTWRVVTAMAPLPVFGVGYLLTAALLFVGLLRSPTLFRTALVVGVWLLSFFAIGTGSAIVADLVDRGDTPGGAGPGLFAFFAICLMAQAREPRTNPDAAGR